MTMEINRAGRDLDVLVAKHVFGCKVVMRKPEKKTFPNGYKDWTYERCANHHSTMEMPECMCDPDEQYSVHVENEHCHFGPRIDDPDESQKCRVLPEYSQNIADAWMVVERLEKNGYSIRLSNKAAQGYWWCFIYSNRPNHDWEATAQADNAELAICLAAIKLEGLWTQKI